LETARTLEIKVNRHSNPDTLNKPLGNYSHVVEVPAGSRLYYLAGQVGVKPDGTFPPTVVEQMHVCYDNVDAILKANGLDWSDVVRVKTLVVATEMERYQAARDQVRARTSNPPPASTLIGVACLARPQILIEVEAIAAKSD
jgi:enamine deaminase RidA (YjgF/YER057c/UK114 family)